jgi:hypothetical protein
MDARLPVDDPRERGAEPVRIDPNRVPQAPVPEVLDIDARIERLREQPRREIIRPTHSNRQSSSSQPAAGRLPSVKPAKPSPERKQVERRPQRTSGPALHIGLNLRTEERNLLYDVGRFRVVSVADLARHLYGGNLSQLRGDLQYLRQKDLVEIHHLNLRRDGRSKNIEHFEAVTLTKSAQKMLERGGSVPTGQRIYSGLVKRREAEHDSQIYGAFQKEIASLKLSGSRDVRVQLDFELKANFNRAVYLARKAQPNKHQDEIKQEVAQQLHLQINKGKIVVPDARLEYEQPDGMTGRVEIEVATAAYRHGHITAKARAGFKVYMSHGDIGRLGAGVQDDHDLMSEIFDL